MSELYVANTETEPRPTLGRTRRALLSAVAVMALWGCDSSNEENASLPAQVECGERYVAQTFPYELEQSFIDKLTMDGVSREESDMTLMEFGGYIQQRLSEARTLGAIRKDDALALQVDISYYDGKTEKQATTEALQISNRLAQETSIAPALNPGGAYLADSEAGFVYVFALRRQPCAT